MKCNYSVQVISFKYLQRSSWIQLIRVISDLYDICIAHHSFGLLRVSRQFRHCFYYNDLLNSIPIKFNYFRATRTLQTTLSIQTLCVKHRLAVWVLAALIKNIKYRLLPCWISINFVYWKTNKRKADAWIRMNRMIQCQVDQTKKREETIDFNDLFRSAQYSYSARYFMLFVIIHGKTSQITLGNQAISGNCERFANNGARGVCRQHASNQIRNQLPAKFHQDCNDKMDFCRNSHYSILPFLLRKNSRTRPTHYLNYRS